MTLRTGFVSPDWYKTDEGRKVVRTIVHHNRGQRKPFGLLDRPSRLPQLTLDEFEYKIFVSGKTGVGKTSTIANLSAYDIPQVHCETPGIHTSIAYWPVKIVDIDRVMLFKLHFWDAGENAMKKFDHILPACRERADAVLFTFSFSDKSTFDDLPQQMSRILEPQDNICKFVAGIKLDEQETCSVSTADMHEFSSTWKLPVLTVVNIGSDHNDDQVATLLNYMCDELWRRDRLLAGQARQHRDRLAAC